MFLYQKEMPRVLKKKKKKQERRVEPSENRLVKGLRALRVL